MVINLSKYRVNFPVVEAYLNTHGRDNLVEACTMLAIQTQAPCIVIAYYLLEIVGPNDILDKQIESLKKFYQIKEVVE